MPLPSLSTPTPPPHHQKKKNHLNLCWHFTNFSFYGIICMIIIFRYKCFILLFFQLHLYKNFFKKDFVILKRERECQHKWKWQGKGERSSGRLHWAQSPDTGLDCMTLRSWLEWKPSQMLNRLHHAGAPCKTF